MKYILILMVILSGCATWDREEKILEATYLMAQTIDYSQSIQIVKHPELYTEFNFAIGKNPSIESLTIYNVVTFISHPILSHYLKRHRKKWQYFTLGMELHTIVDNHQLGIKINF